MSVPVHLSPTVTVLDGLIAAIQAAAAWNRNDQVAPDVVLWPDKERQWETLIPAVRGRMPLLTFGVWAPGERTGPAYWLRCMVDRTLDDDRLPDDVVPIIYLPGVSRADLRAVEECPRELQPLAELQYRGVIWSHRNGKDWTPGAFLQTVDGGLGIELQGNGATRMALQRALPRVAQEPVLTLRRQAPLRAEDFDIILNPDEVLQLLRWLNDPAGEQVRLSAEEWDSFCSLCGRRYGFSPVKDGPVSAARLLGERKGHWEKVWNRFAEAPGQYPAIAPLLARAEPVYRPTLFDAKPMAGADDPQSSWPGVNRSEEDTVRARLLALKSQTPVDARTDLLELERMQGARRDWVWSTLAQSPLAGALEPLARLATATGTSLTGATVEEVAQRYADDGWQADAAMIDALVAVQEAASPDLTAVQAAISAIYRPWLEETATRFQQLVLTDPQAYRSAPLAEMPIGTCIVFCDGLRQDLAHRLTARLEGAGLQAEIDWSFAALPTVTATAKPAASPVASHLTGDDAIGTVVKQTGQRVTAQVLRKVLTDAGYQVLAHDDAGDPAGRAWTEAGNLDAYGHQAAWKVAWHAAAELRAIGDRVAALFAHGWRQVMVITDHGWLLLPDGLPKTELKEHLTEVRKGRCARLKPGAQVEIDTVPWYWDPSVRIAVAPGISCFEAGKSYEHGGLSPQECVVPIVTVRTGGSKQGIEIQSLKWTGLRCDVELAGASTVLKVDLRRRPMDQASSVAIRTKHPDPDGTLALFADDEADGADAWLIVVAPDETILVQRETRVGGEER